MVLRYGPTKLAMSSVMSGFSKITLLEISGSLSFLDPFYWHIFHSGTFKSLNNYAQFRQILISASIYNVVVARRRQKLPVLPVFLEWTPMVIFTLSCGFWLYSPHTTLLEENRLVLFCLTMSFVFGRMTTKIILAHLTHQPFPYWTILLAPLIGGAVLANLPSFGLYVHPFYMIWLYSNVNLRYSAPVSSFVELWYLRGYFVFAVIVYFRWAMLVIDGICSYLGIQCLSIPYTPAPHPGALNGAAHPLSPKKERAA